MHNLTLNEGYRELCVKTQGVYPGVPSSILELNALRLQDACADVSGLIKTRVLDLGCGSEKSLDRPGWIEMAMSGFRPFHYLKPWYLRLAHAAGAETFGIDLAPNRGEPFVALQRDLTQPEGFHGLSQGSFEIINNKLFTADRGDAFRHFRFSPALLKSLGNNHDAAYELNERIRARVEGLLTEGGIYTFADSICEKTEGELVLVNK